jgi:hypothetical protein
MLNRILNKQQSFATLFAFQVSGELPFGIRPRSRIKYTLLGLTTRAPTRILEIRRVYTIYSLTCEKGGGSSYSKFGLKYVSRETF